MRAAALLGLSSSEKDLRPFQKESNASWFIGMPSASNEADAVLILGGDGTVHRYLAQLVKLQLPVLVVPYGSGNDFARALNLRKGQDALAAWRAFCSGADNVRTIDLGVIAPLDVSGNAKRESKRYFCCVGGVGLDGEIARRANQMPRWLRAHGGYAMSLLPALFRFAPFPMKITLAGREQLEGITGETKPLILAAFANAPAYGGGLRIAPHAKLDDGKLDVCVVTDIDRFRLFCLFPTVYFGRHLSIPQVKYFQAEQLRIETEKPLEVYADGEYVCRTPVEVSVEHAVLRVIVPVPTDSR